MKKRVAGLLIAGLATTGLGLGATVAAFADPTATPTPGASSTPGSGSTPGQADGGQARHGRQDGALAKQLADKLKIEEAKVVEALRAAREELRGTASTARQQGQRPDPAAREEALAGKLADKLGVDQARVKQALTEIRAAHQAERTQEFKTTLDKAVTDGKLTRTEADAVLKAAQAGVIGMGGRHR